MTKVKSNRTENGLRREMAAML